jgi:hypothetical protein
MPEIFRVSYLHAQSEEVTSLDVAASSDRLKELPDEKPSAGDSASWGHQSGHSPSIDRESARNATVRPRAVAVSCIR